MLNNIVPFNRLAWLLADLNDFFETISAEEFDHPNYQDFDNDY
jgi:hypothetical protein